MPNFFCTVAIIAALLCSPVVGAQTLWTKAEYGMTESQVKAAFPEVIAASKPDHLYGGAVGSLIIPGIQVAESPFRANFFFVSGKLVQVTLSLEDKAGFDTVLSTFGAIEEILRAKYGSEIRREIKRGTLNTAEATWLSGPTNINLYASGVASNKASLNINYQVRISKEAEKL
jgi:hypothetical protein